MESAGYLRRRRSSFTQHLSAYHEMFSTLLFRRSSRNSFSSTESENCKNAACDDLIQLRSSPNNSQITQDSRSSTLPRKKSLDSPIPWRKQNKKNSHSTNEADRFSQIDPTISPTTTCFSADDLDDIFGDTRSNNMKDTTRLSPGKVQRISGGDCSMDEATSDNNESFDRAFIDELESSSTESIKNKVKKSRLDVVTNTPQTDSGHILNPMSPLSPILPDGRVASPIQMVCREIFMTEKTYVNDLQLVIEGYIYHLKQQKDSDIESIFGNLEAIFEFNKEVLYEMEQCQVENNEMDPIKLAKLFIEKARGFNYHYTQYCTHYPSASSFFSLIMEDDKIANFFLERQKVIGHALPLESYLLKPVQRIMKYHLLFRDIMKRFQGSNEEFKVIETAVIAMSDVAEYINEMKRLHENAVKVQEILTTIELDEPIDVFATGRLVLENTFKIHGARGDRLIYLFEKLLLICKKSEEKMYLLKDKIECSNMMLVESLSKDPLAFQILRFDNQKVAYTIIAKSQEIKKSWVQHLKRLILENHTVSIPQTARQAILGVEEKAKSKYNSLPMKALDDQVIGNLKNMKAKTLPRTPMGKENMQVHPGVKRESNDQQHSSAAKRTLNAKAKEYIMERKKATGVSLSPQTEKQDKDKKDRPRWMKRHKHKNSLDGTLMLEGSDIQLATSPFGLPRSRSLESLKDNIQRTHDASEQEEQQVLKDIINANFENSDNDLRHSIELQTPSLENLVDRPTIKEIASTFVASETINNHNSKNNDGTYGTSVESNFIPRIGSVSLTKCQSINMPATRKISNESNSGDVLRNRWSTISPEQDALDRLEKRLSLLADDDTSTLSIKNLVRRVSNAFNSSYQAYDDSPKSELTTDMNVSRDLNVIFGTENSESTHNKSRYRRSTGGLANASMLIPTLQRSRSELSVFSKHANIDALSKFDIANLRVDEVSHSEKHPFPVKEDDTVWNENVHQVFNKVTADLDSIADSLSNDETLNSQETLNNETSTDENSSVKMDIIKNDTNNSNNNCLCETPNTPTKSRKINVEVKRVADRIKEYKKIVDAEKRSYSWRHRETKTMNEMMESLDSITSSNGTLSPVYSTYRRRFRISKDVDDSQSDLNNLFIRSMSNSSQSDVSEPQYTERSRSLTSYALIDRNSSGSNSSLNSIDMKINNSDSIHRRTEKYHQALIKDNSKKNKMAASKDHFIRSRAQSETIGNNKMSAAELFFTPNLAPVSRCTSNEWLVKSRGLPEPKRSNAIKRPLKQNSLPSFEQDSEDHLNENNDDNLNNENNKSESSDNENVYVHKESTNKVSTVRDIQSLPRQVTLIMKVSKGEQSKSHHGKDSKAENHVSRHKKQGPVVKAKPRSMSVPAVRRTLVEKRVEIDINSNDTSYPREFSDSSSSQDEKHERGRSTTKQNGFSKRHSTINRNKKKSSTDDNQNVNSRTVRSASLPRRAKKSVPIPVAKREHLTDATSESSLLRSPSIRCIEQNHVNNRIKEYFTHLENASKFSQSKPNLVLVGNYNSCSSDDESDDIFTSDGRVSPSSEQNNNVDQILRGRVRSMIKRYGSSNYVFDS